MHRFRPILLLIGLSFLIFSGAIPSVFACSGPAYSFQNSLDYSAIIVYGSIIEIDDFKWNFIVEVDEYLFGTQDNRYLLVSRGSSGYLNYRLENNTGGSCSGAPLRAGLGEKTYFFLDIRDNGTYILRDNIIFRDDVLDFQLNDENGHIYGETFSQSEFYQFMVDELGKVPHLPDLTTSYPRYSVLLLKTADGSYFYLPINSNNLLPLSFADYYSLYNDDIHLWNGKSPECSDYDCLKISQNNIYLGIQVANDRIQINDQQYDGLHFLLSPTGDAVAIWDEANIPSANYNLRITLLQHDRIHGWLQDRVSYEHFLDTHDPVLASAWSPDGRIFAFSDDNGLWLWDALSKGAEPELLIESDAQGIPIAIQFSPLGRYLLIDDAGVRYNFDLIAENKLPDGLLSPDERMLLAFDTQADRFTLDICRVLSEECNTLSDPVTYTYLSDNPNDGIAISIEELVDVRWIDSHTILASGCGEFDGDEYCAVGTIDALHPLFNIFTIDGAIFEYDPIGEMIATVADDFTIIVDEETIDLKNQINSPIVEIQWLPSFFYQK